MDCFLTIRKLMKKTKQTFLTRNWTSLSVFLPAFI
ncbi:hypothetical protein BVRB_6g137550 [Beta vulgaris subsp. vulgaris]|nr:hypothetical protein BVRB_6g137550 [Beta vulgaris subsp. vulgaris]